ncbi:trans-sulfuration enzyme family protein [Saccharopolyspora mangrovi]|uniref:Aminotransferase class I/II-fold pyridoxal phosphate-dependent enzyme n=1 Tax=Saccharopolyspora mangrovi TaxID=3082379 RepID=A0ABU6ABQ2_9PSEU|nr:aminotransferase class I/II-fold pyridoxal phosphate-dependent enzyme [Saccharopolyspora sp. S2-29]MEB3368896.1 aminotransferase class I/II-fold pyridoxal phosphate-dependent enzyme [Saccharopolyspora sp. S2-29]
MSAPDKHDPSTVGEKTWAVHGGNSPDGSGALRTPLVLANSYLLPEDASQLNWSDTSTLMYSRSGHVNQHALEDKLATMEGGEEAVVFASGVAALHALFFTHLRSGDHVVVSAVTYEAVHRLFSELLPDRYGIQATFVDATDPEAVRAAMRPTTRLVHVETIANPTTAVTDIAAVAEIAHAGEALLSVDGTFTPPPLYRPLADGADVVVHSLTKFINGHGDAMGGAVIGSRELVSRIRADALVDVGGVLSPFNSWLIMRGSVTLPLRLLQHLASAQQIAESLEADPRIAFVAYPGLASHPQHELAVRQFGGRGCGAVLAFALDGDPAVQNRFVNALRVITSAVSLGHDESLIVHVAPGTRGGDEHYPEPFQRYGHLRLAVGLEDTDDLIADLRAALDIALPA